MKEKNEYCILMVRNFSPSTPPSLAKKKLIIITGPSGAGRTTAINILEDLGFETVDNIPLSMIGELVFNSADTRDLALCLDVRTRDFSVDMLLSVIKGYETDKTIEAKLIFLTCEKSILQRRFSETRRKHPLAGKISLTKALENEIDLISPLRELADILIDTSELKPNELRIKLLNAFEMASAVKFEVSIHSFSYKRGLPRSLDMVVDCRFLSNPHWVKKLRPLDGRSSSVANFINDDINCTQFLSHVRVLLEFLLPNYKKEGKAYFSIGFGCTGGQHRSVFIAETIFEMLLEKYPSISIRHRELERKTRNSNL